MGTFGSFNAFSAVTFIGICTLTCLALRQLSCLIYITDTTTGVLLMLFATGFFCTQLVSHVLTFDTLLNFLLTLWVTFTREEWINAFKPDSQTVTDAFHQLLVYQIVAASMVPPLVWFLSTDTTDVTVRTALALSRLVGLGTVAALTVEEQHGFLSGFMSTYITGGGAPAKPLLGHTVYLQVVLPLFTLALSYAVHLVHNSHVRVTLFKGQLDAFLRADTLLTTLAALFCLLAPNQIAVNCELKPDRNHLYLYRVLGCMYAGQVCLSHIAQRMRAFSSRRSILFAKALTGMVVAVILLTMCQTQTLPDSFGTRLLMICQTILTLPAAVGCLSHDHEGWDLPWRGLRVPQVKVGGATNIVKPHPKYSPPGRRRAAGRGRGRGGKRRH